MLEANSVRIASRLFFKLLKDGQLKEKDDKKLYYEYMNNVEVRNVMEIICEESNCRIKHINDYIYLLPNEDNDILGFDYKIDESLRTAKNMDEFYLTQYIITVIFSEFFHEIHPATYLDVIDLMDIVSERLKTASEKVDIELEENEARYNVVKLHNIWDAKLKWSESSTMGKKTTSMDYKIGVIRRVISFLKKQDLVIEVEDEDKIKPKNRLENLMDGDFLNKDRVELINKLFSEDSILQ